MPLHATFRDRSIVLLYVWTFGLAVPLLACAFQLYHSPYYQLYTWLIHHTPTWIIDDVEAASDDRLLRQMIASNDRHVEDARSFLERRPSSRKPVIEFTSGIKERTPSVDGIRDSGKSAPVVVMVTVISSNRDVFVEAGGFRFSPRYLVQNIARFLKAIDARTKFTVGNNIRPVEYRLSVCSVGDDVTPEEEFLARLVPVIRYRAAEADATGFDKMLDRMAWRYEKEKLDYVYCLEETLRRAGCDPSKSSTGDCLESSDDVTNLQEQLYVLLVEDDALPTDDALSVVDRLVSAGHWSSKLDETSRDIVDRGYYKLFHPKHLHGFISIEVERLPQLVAWAAFFGTILHIICSRFAARQLNTPRLSWTGCCIFVVLLALAIGRAHLDGWRALLSPYFHYIVPDNFCCTQAFLYPARTAAEVVDRLRRLHCNETFHKDEALWSLRADGIRGLLVQPNVFEHVGIFSALRGGFVDPHVLIAG